MIVRVGTKTDIGRTRQRNEDSLLVAGPLFALADGMGGHRGGDVASSLALEVLGSEGDGEGPVQAGPPDRARSEGDLLADRAEWLVERVRKANRRVLERGEADRDLRGMGTTLVAAELEEGDRAILVHVGDSRAYLLREGELQQLTKDHTLVQRLVSEGRLTAQEAAHHPQRNILTRALGVDEDIPVDQLTLDLHPRDRLLLCTDGLTNMVGADRIRDVLVRAQDPQEACDRLVEFANRAGGEDNITVIVLAFDENRASGDRDAEGHSTAELAAIPDEPARPGDGGGAAGAAQRTSVSTLAAPQAGDTEVAAPKAQAGEAEPAAAPRRARWTRFVAVGAVIVVVAAAVIGIRTYIRHQWYVGASDGNVAIYNGLPTKVLGVRLSHVQETTVIPAARAEQLQQWRALGGGITAHSLTDARAIVAQIQRDVQATAPGAG